MRFLHAADIHLGNQQYNLPERYDDFHHGFERVAQIAIDEKVDVCLIAGDLFHKAELDPFTLLQAESSLRKMRDAHIQVLAISGNHDRLVYRNAESWLGYLHRNNYLTLLDPGQQEFGLILGKTAVDIGGVRFIGVPWFGSATQAALNKLAEQCTHASWNDIHYTVLMLHAAVEGQHPDIPGVLRIADLLPLRPYVLYIALGHLHKPYIIDNWLHNPGSVETCEFSEAAYQERGVILVDVHEGEAEVRLLPLTRRPFYTIYFDVDSFHTPNDLITKLRQTVQDECARWSENALKPVVRVILRGTLAFDRGALDTESITALLKEDTNALMIRLELRLQGFEIQFDGDSEITVDRLEREIFEDIARREPRFRAHAPEWAAWMRDVKDKALQKDSPEHIYALLVDQMKQYMKDAQ